MKLIIGLIFILSFWSCTNEKLIREQVRKAVQEDPTIVFDAIKKEPTKFMETIQEVSRAARAQFAKKQEEQRKSRKIL